VNLPVSEPKPLLPGGGPEGLFRVDDLSVGDAPHGRMITGPWMTGPDGRPSPGGLGVLVDDVLGYAILAARPRNDWSVSTEIALDVLGPVPGDGSRLRVVTDFVQSGRLGGLASGRVLDESGRLIALGRQRGRFVSDLPAGERPESVADWQPAGLLRPAPDAPAAGTSAAGPSTAGTASVDAAQLLGLQWAGPGLTEPVLEVTDLLTNPLGNLHGGISLCASELVATQVLLPSGPPLVTASIQVAYLRPSPVGSVLRLTASVRHRGRTLGVVQVVGTNANGKACTIATITAHQPD
jgi:uncharacterized protein (TIGR00369 family)